MRALAETPGLLAHWCNLSRPSRIASMVLTIIAGIGISQAAPKLNAAQENRVAIESQGWQLIGDLILPSADEPLPFVIMLNQADGNRTAYQDLAEQLGNQRIGSLRLDLRGHGESTNQGRFVPGEASSRDLIFEAEADVVAALRFVRSNERIDGSRIALIGASYSGEEMLEASRMVGYVKAYALLSPGSLSEESVISLDTSGASCLFIAASEDVYLQDITKLVQERSQNIEIVLLPGTAHGTDLLEQQAGLSEQLAQWLARHL